MIRAIGILRRPPALADNDLGKSPKEKAEFIHNWGPEEAIAGSLMTISPCAFGRRAAARKPT